MSTDYKQMLSSLTLLDRGQLEEIRRRAAFLLQHKTSPAAAEDEDWLLAGILAELGQRGQDDRQFRLKRASSYAGFQTQSEHVRQMLERAAPDLSLVERRALGEVAARSLALRLERWTDVNRENMLRYVGQVPEAVEDCYPGYMASGLLSAVVTHKVE